jgi:hypothetical protein
VTTFIRVTDNDTGHQYDIAESAFDETLHKKLDDPEYPDLSGDNARPRPPVHAAPSKTAAKSAAATTKAGTPAGQES